MKRLLVLMMVSMFAMSAFGLMTVTEDFTTDPSWAEKSNRIGDTIGYHVKRSSYGYLGEGPAYSHTGEAGGLMNRSHPAYGNSYYGDAFGSALTLNDAFSVSGTYEHVNTYTNGNPHPGMDGLPHVGYANKVALDSDATGNEWYTNAITLSFAGWDRVGIVALGSWVQIGGWTNDGWDPTTDPYTAGTISDFTLSYDPAAGAFGQVTASWDNGTAVLTASYDLTEAQRTSGATFDLMGFGCRVSGSDDQRSQGYYDDFAYTVPEPATLGLLALGGLILRKKH